ncbi:MAG: hypothetical protein HYW24_02125 [Candidatus Aenigmarchaeota archaeon]|nr:hypothetical protein [Candidatus Aenigmarchaeota archaeon]
MVVVQETLNLSADIVDNVAYSLRHSNGNTFDEVRQRLEYDKDTVFKSLYLLNSVGLVQIRGGNKDLYRLTPNGDELYSEKYDNGGIDIWLKRNQEARQ